jgi:tyrosyl-tRNA synthetase
MEFTTQMPMDEVTAVARGLEDGSVHPREAKARLAREIVAMWHGPEAAAEAERAFERVFKGHELPEKIPEARLGRESLAHGKIRVVDLLVQAGLADSKSEARRLISQGGVSLDGGVVQKPDAEVSVKDGLVLRVGRRRFARIRLH